MRQKKKIEESKLEEEKQEACVKCSKLQNGRHSSFEETETPSKQTTLSTLKSVLKRSASHRKEKVTKTSDKLAPKEMQSVTKKTKNRVQFDETQNKYFEADYVILIHEEDYDLDDYYDEGSPYDDEDDDGYDEGLNPPKICCSNPNCNNMITLTNYPVYGYANNGLMDFNSSRRMDRDCFDFSSPYYDANYEEVNQNLRRPSANTTNRCENEKCQNCHNYFDFEGSPKIDSSQDFGDQVTLSPPEGYKDGGCCPHHGPHFNNAVNDMSQKNAGDLDIEFQHGDNHSEEEEEEDQDYDGNDISTTRKEITTAPEKISDEIKEDSDNMQEEEKLKQRYIVETITMTTVTERRIVREASPADDESPQILENSKRSGILKGGKFWKNLTDKTPTKTVNYNESVNFNENIAETGETEETDLVEEDREKVYESKQEEKNSDDKVELSERREEINKLEKEGAVSPESTELTLTFKLGQHLLVANSLKPNSAMRQLFPSPRFVSPPPLEDGEGVDKSKQIPPKQFLVTAESLRLFEEAKKSKILENMNSEDSGQSFIAIMPPTLKNLDDLENNRIQRTIERNTLRRSLVKYSYDYRNKRLSEEKKNENSLEERIRQLTCGIDDEEPQEDKKEEAETAELSRSSPQGEESKEPMKVDTRNLKYVESAPPPSTTTSTTGSSSTYKKLTDLFSRKSHPPPVVEDINRNIKSETVNVQCDLVLHSQTLPSNYSCGPYGQTLPNQRNYSQRMPMTSDSKKQFLSTLAPLTSCVNPEDKDRYRLIEGGDRNHLGGENRSEYSLQDIADGLKEPEPKKLGNQPDVIAETPQNEGPNDELALFVQQDAGRIEKIKKKYSEADNSDEDDDYGFNKRPLVKGIKTKYNTTNETSPSNSQVHGQGQGCPASRPATTTATTTTVHTTWPYYSQENPDPKFRNMYPPKLQDDKNLYGIYGNPHEYRWCAETGSTNYVGCQGVGQQRMNFTNQRVQHNMYSSMNTYYRCQPTRFAGAGYSELSNYQFRHPPHSPPPVRRVMNAISGPNQTDDNRVRVENRVFVTRSNEGYSYLVAGHENCPRPNPNPTDGSKVVSPPNEGNVKNPEMVFQRRAAPNIPNPCLQMKFSPLNYNQGAVPTASIRLSASCTPHPVVDESNVIIEPHYSTFSHPSNQNTVGVIRVGQGQQMIRVPVPYSTGTPVQVHLMAGRLGRCDSPQRPGSPKSAIKVPVQPFNQYLIARSTQTAQNQSFATLPPKTIPDGAPSTAELNKTVDFEKQGKAIAEELQLRQKIALSRSVSQETNHQNVLLLGNPSPVGTLTQQERGVPEGAASSTVQDCQVPNSENPTVTSAGNTVYYTMNV